MAQLPTRRRLIIPLSVGNHVDHQLTRRSAELWLDKNRSGSQVIARYYEDYPYVRDPVALRAVIDRDPAWRSETIKLSSDALKTKIEAISCYRSQLSTFFSDNQDLASQIVEYAGLVGGERLWSR